MKAFPKRAGEKLSEAATLPSAGLTPNRTKFLRYLILDLYLVPILRDIVFLTFM